ncbi:MAG TPA: hypothetical protein VFT22_38540 [Kofleriaceae bacterium]|nr:hypothetical protein [Kofleriaceae bacterium]
MKRITLITLGSVLAACSSSSKQATPEQYDDTAQAIASTTATGGGGGDVASMADTVTISLGAMPQGFTLSADGQIQGSRLGVDYSYKLTCKNLAGVVGACGATTDGATVEVAWSGNLGTPNLDASVSRNGSWTVTGLQTDTATFSGDSSFSFDATVRSIFRPGVTASYSFDASASYDAVRIATQDRRVIDGSASFDVSAHSQVTGAGSNNADAAFDVHAALTFHADHTASLVLDGSRSYSIDLTTGVVIRVN